MLVTTSRPKELTWEVPKGQVQISFSKLAPPEVVVQKLSQVKGPVDIYCWYEGEQGLFKEGARFMKEAIFAPLYRMKEDAKLWLYSLRAWEFLSKKRMDPSTLLGEAVNRIDKRAVECIYSSAFFEYCCKQRALYDFVQGELPKKTWLKALSEEEKPCGKTVGALFKNQSCLFDCIKECDAKRAYSYMQYVEGYYLIRESVRRGLENRQRQVQIAFVLPNDESKFYLDFPKDIEAMLQLEFQDQLADVEININFFFFEYQLDRGISSRPYIDKSPNRVRVTEAVVGQYFDYLGKEK